jgi:hypothetical protein
MPEKKQLVTIVILVIGLVMSGCGAGKSFEPTFTPTWMPTLPPTFTPLPTSPPTNTPTLISPPKMVDDFDDGAICNIWNAYSTDHAKSYETNGVLNIDIGTGPVTDGGNQVSGIESKDFVLSGDFDIQVDFQLSADYHSAPEANTKLILFDHNGYGLEISIRTDTYLSKEVFPDGSGIEKISTPTTDLSGKLRIAQIGNQVTTYYWENGWLIHAQWEPQYVTGDLKIVIDSWNMSPNFRSFNTKFDNLQIYNALITSCVR